MYELCCKYEMLQLLHSHLSNSIRIPQITFAHYEFQLQLSSNAYANNPCFGIQNPPQMQPWPFKRITFAIVLTWYQLLSSDCNCNRPQPHGGRAPTRCNPPHIRVNKSFGPVRNYSLSWNCPILTLGGIFPLSHPISPAGHVIAETPLTGVELLFFLAGYT